MNDSDIDDNVVTAVDNVVSLDTNYVTYNQVKMENPSATD